MQSITIMSEDQALQMADFLRGVDAITVINADDPVLAAKGFVAFYVRGGEERSLWFGWRYAKPVAETEVLKGERISIALRECMDDGWDLCDDPARRLLGFAKYVAEGDEGESRRRVVGLSDIKAVLSGEMREEVIAYRQERMDAALAS